LRCLFVPDELEAFRPVAMVFRDERIEHVMLRGYEAARLVLGTIRFDVLIVGANSIDSPALPFLRHARPPHLPALGVTCVPWMREELREAGAADVVLLPDETARLAAALRTLLKPTRH
jgi:hypothetical protein